jgi:large subunit ribosomal protein L25
MVDLVVGGGSATKVLVKEVQRDPIDRHVLHIDLHQIALDEVVQIEVEIRLKGIPRGTQEGGVLEQVLHAIRVECLPTAIPEHLVVDVQPLGMEESMKASAVSLPEGVKLLTPADSLLAIVQKPRVEEVVAPAPAEEAAKEPEVIGQKEREERAKLKEDKGGKPAAKEKEEKGTKPKEDKKE